MDKIVNAVLESGTIEENAYIIVGFSGGPDSLTLLHALNRVKDSMGLTLIPVHVNHELRGEKSDAEQAHAEDMCREMGLECTIVEADCKKLAEDMKISEEEAGRFARYTAFSQIASGLEEQGVEHERIFIAVAQNADDQSETVMFRILRGTGTRGLSGIPPVRLDENGYYVVRPLLDVERCDIEEYVKANGLEPNRDESNETTDYSRNRIRNELFPYLEKNFNPNIKEVLRRLADIAAIDDDFMETVALEVYADVTEVDTAKSEVRLHLEPLIEQHDAVISRVVALMLSDIGLDSVTSYQLIYEIMSVIYSSNPSASLTLPGGVIAEREYDDLVVRALGDEGSEADRYATDGLRLVASVVKKEDFSAPDDMHYAAFDFDKFSSVHPGQIGDIVLRTRRPGDTIDIGSGNKKIQDVFVDEKVPRSRRGSIPMAVIGSEVLWILPDGSFRTPVLKNKGKYSQKYQITDATKEVLFLEIVKGL
jgi:tRNA(Ile)-lysidine synthase